MVRHRATSGSSGGDSGYRPSQNLVCKITNVEAGVYACIVMKDNLPGFLPTNVHLKEGEELMARYVCVHHNRILLSAHFLQTDLSSGDKRQE